MTSEQIKSRLRRQGVTLTAWAEKHGYPRADVYRVLNGQYKCHYGRAHEIAVKLGMKAASDSEPLAA